MGSIVQGERTSMYRCIAAHVVVVDMLDVMEEVSNTVRNKFARISLLEFGSVSIR